jgi:hypothetical protein
MSNRKTWNERAISTPKAITIQLRSDRNLDPAIANVLALLVTAAYKDLSQNKNEE